MPLWETIIGLEVHIELKTASKMFCGCSASYFGHDPNTHVCPVCLGLPGAMPVPNKRAIEMTLLTGMALGCQIPVFSKFDRKNYFYPDLPKGFQISQYDLPLTVNGKWQITEGKWIRVRRVHLEEDTGKLIHASVGNKRVSLIDFNRSGVPLMEIVTEPDLRSIEEVGLWARKLRQMIKYLNVSEADMEKGQMRFELNLSLARPGWKKLPNYKVEVKNLNSFRFLEKAAQFEIQRQKEILEEGKVPLQETRGFDQVKEVTFSQRFKEEAQDYRYFPEPDIPPLRWTREFIEGIRKQVPELPWEKEKRFLKDYQLSPEYVRLLTISNQKADYFEEAVKVGKKHDLQAKEIANVLINKKFNRGKILPADLVRILKESKTKPSLPEEELKTIIKKVIAENPTAVAEYKKGKLTTIEFLVGQVMKLTRGQAEPKKVRKIFIEKLGVK